MPERIRARLTYANVMATIAVFVALGGTGYAAAKVGSAQIKNNSIQGKDIKNSTIQGKDVKNGSLASGDFKAGQLPAGPAGPTGPAGAPGAPGTARAYAFVEDGQLQPAQSKGILGMSPGCIPSSCDPPNPGEGSVTTYCFRLAFTPSNVQITPRLVPASSANAVDGFAGVAPAPTESPSSASCPTGFVSALAEVWGNTYSAPATGFYVAFN